MPWWSWYEGKLLTRHIVESTAPTFPANELLNAGAPQILEFRHIALQAEGQQSPVWFRKIELRSLEAR